MARKTSSTQSPVVVSYLRFSRPEQLKGDSVRRQLELSQRWAQARGLTIDENISDRGVSAFRGANATSGALASFLRLVDGGRVPPESVLLVESLDRLSRTELLKALQQFLSIVNAGVRIVTLADGFEYSRDNCNLQNLMYSLMVMSRAHEESAIKAQRLSEAWRGKRQRMHEKPLTRMVPAWCRIEGGRIVLDKAKAPVVRQLFKLAAKGYGLNQITRKINAEAEGFGRVKYFNRSYVFKILRNRAVLGEFQPHRNTWVGGKKRREPIGDPIPDYYPRVVTDAAYYAANGSVSSKRGTGGRSSKFINLFTGLLYSFEDKSRLQVQDKGYGRRYVSSAAILGRKGASRFVGFPVKPFETAMLLRLGEPDTFTVDQSDNSVQTDLTAAEAHLSETEAKIQQVQETLLSGRANSASVVDLLNKVDTRRSELQGRVKELRQTAATAGGGNNVAEFHSLLERHIKGSLSADERVHLRGVLRNVIERVSCLFRREGRDYLGSTAIHLRNGTSLNLAFRAVYRDTMLRNKLGHPIPRPGGPTEPEYDLSILIDDAMIGRPVAAARMPQRRMPKSASKSFSLPVGARRVGSHG